jgi:hypothetical protein
MKKFSMATAGATVLTLISVSTASAAILSGSGTISGTVDGPIGSGTEISSSLGVNPGDPISGNFSFSYDDLIFNTASDTVEIPLDTFNLSVGSQVLVPASPSFLPFNPLVVFTRSGNSFVFDTIVADLRYSTPSLSNIYTQLTGGSALYGNTGEGLLFATAPLTTGWTSSPEIGGFSSPGGVTQTCQGRGCSFTPTPPPMTSVPETTPTLSLLAFGLLGMSLLSKQRKVREN